MKARAIHSYVRWLIRRRRFEFRSEATFLSESVWTVEDAMTFSTGQVLKRRMYVQITGPDRLHVAADDMPGGADILLHERGFTFTPYLILVSFAGRDWRLRCFDECRVDDSGMIHDTIRMRFLGVPVATITIRLRVERD